jgi:hypothetical protein
MTKPVPRPVGKPTRTPNTKPVGKPATNSSNKPKDVRDVVVMAQVVEPEPEFEPQQPVVDEPETEPEQPVVDEPELEDEPLEPVMNSVMSTALIPHPDDKYLQLYTEHIRIQEENLRLRRKVIRLEENLKQWQTKKATKKAKLQGEELTNAIVDIILRSNLNIESLPDDVERELYSFIINQISGATGTVSCLRKLFFCA